MKAPERSSWNGALKGYYIGYKISDSGDQYLYKTIDKQSFSHPSSSFSNQHKRKNSLMLNLTNVSSSSDVNDQKSSNRDQEQRHAAEKHHHSSSDALVTLKGLKPLTEYIILVQAYNSFGAGPQSDGLLIKTTEDGECQCENRSVINHHTSIHFAAPRLLFPLFIFKPFPRFPSLGPPSNAHSFPFCRLHTRSEPVYMASILFDSGLHVLMPLHHNQQPRS